MHESKTARILIADDQPDVVAALRMLLKGEGYAAETAASPAGVLQALEARDFDVLLIDLNYTRDTTSGLEGLEDCLESEESRLLEVSFPGGHGRWELRRTTFRLDGRPHHFEPGHRPRLPSPAAPPPPPPTPNQLIRD